MVMLDLILLSHCVGGHIRYITANSHQVVVCLIPSAQHLNKDDLIINHTAQ